MHIYIYIYTYAYMPYVWMAFEHMWILGRALYQTIYIYNYIYNYNDIYNV